MKTIAIVISTQNGGVGMNDELPWLQLKTLKDNYEELAVDQIVLVGRNSYEKFSHMRGAMTYVYTNNADFQETEHIKKISGTPQEVIDVLKERHPDKNIIIGGGVAVFEQFFDLIDEWRVTIIEDYAIFNREVDLTRIKFLHKNRKLVGSGEDTTKTFTTSHMSKE